MFDPGSLIDRYEVVSALGAGGMARVFKVRHSLLGSFHAMKVLDPQLLEDPELRARFLAEGRIQAQLRHPNIVAVTDIIALPGVAGLVADLIEGPTLESAIRNRRAPPTPEEVKAIFLPLLDGLEYAHSRGIVHRDIKPSNIVLDQGRPGVTTPRIIDFGIAKITESPLGPQAAKGKTRTGARMGTLHYMSPEQVKGQSDVDARADTFSMAVTLFEFISGQVPFDADSDFDTMKQIVEGHPTPIRSLQTDVDPILEDCVIKGLARDLESRFQSCAEFAALLRAAPHVSVPVIARQAPTPRGSSPGSSDDEGTFRANGLEWQQEHAARQMNWADAKSYSASLSLAGGGWRLPTKDELLALYHVKRSTPAIADDNNWYWSSTPRDGWVMSFVGGYISAWYVNINSGAAYPNGATCRGNVRCVR